MEPGSWHRWIWLLLVAAATAFHGPSLTAPFCTWQLNAGAYFGVFCRNWEQFGCWRLRGLPLMSQLVDDVGAATPYVHHPPGLSWMFHLLGGAEWSMRLPTVVGSVLAAWCWFRIVRTICDVRAAAWSAMVLLLCPCMAVVSQASYEVVVIACGLVVFAELLAPIGGRRRSRALQVAAAFFGTWIDWGFGFFAIACVPLALRAGFRAGLRALLWPAAGAGAALVSILVWKHWALGQPGLMPLPTVDSDLVAMFQRFVFGERTDPGWFWRHLSATVATTWSPWLLGTFGLGVGFALVRMPRLLLAVGIVAIAPFVILVRPADYVWHTFQSPLMALTAAAAVDAMLRLPPRGARRLAAVVAALVLAGVAHASWSLRADAATTFFARLGATLTEVAKRPGMAVAHNFPAAMACYLRAPRIVREGIYLPHQLQPLIDRTGGTGWCYLWLKSASPEFVVPGIEQLLSPFPRTRVPELEGTLGPAGDRATGGVAEAWLYTLSEPPR
jgi:hypothetical protein